MPMPSEADRRALACEIEDLRQKYGAGDGAWMEAVEKGLPTILAALRADPDRAAGEREAAERNFDAPKNGLSRPDYEVIGTTYDGVKVLRPKTEPTNFTREEIREAVSQWMTEAALPSDPDAGQGQRQGEEQ